MNTRCKTKEEKSNSNSNIKPKAKVLSSSTFIDTIKKLEGGIGNFINYKGACAYYLDKFSKVLIYKNS